MPASQSSYRSIVAIILALIAYGSAYPRRHAAVVDVVLAEDADPPLAERLSRPGALQAQAAGQGLLERTIILREDQARHVEALAAQTGISPSRTLRRAVGLFMEGVASDD